MSKKRETIIVYTDEGPREIPRPPRPVGPPPPWDFVKTFPHPTWDPYDPNEADGLIRHAGLVWHHAEQRWEGADGEEFDFAYMHGEMFSYLHGALAYEADCKARLAMGVYAADAPKRKAGRALSDADRKILASAAEAARADFENWLGWYQMIFGDEAEAAARKVALETFEPPDPPPAPFAPELFALTGGTR